MTHQVTWDQLDRLLEAYAASCLYMDPREIEVRLSRALADLGRSQVTFDDLSALLASRSESRDMISRRVAWTAQHIFGKRAWMVGSKVLVRLPNEQFASGLLDQLRIIGLDGSQSNAVATLELAGTEGSEGDGGFGQRQVAGQRFSFSTIDALVASPASNEVWVVKGCSYTQAARISPDLWINSDRQSLFGQAERFLSSAYAPAAHVRALLAGRDLVQATHAHLKVRAAYIVINDPGCSWHFQCHDLTSLLPKAAREGKLLLDNCLIHSTYRDYPAHFSREGLGFATLPDFAAQCSDAAFLPGDRPCRAYFLLNELWSRQLNKPRRLASARGEDLALGVMRATALFMAKDQWRHDLEDCLERGGLIRRLTEQPGRFAITPKGVGHLLVLKQKLNRSPDLSTPQLLSHVTHQSRLWATAPVI